VAFSEKVGILTVVCGPGSMEQGHNPNEFVAIDQLDQCERMFAQLIHYLRGG